MKTKDKIILASLQLFNQQGERNITTNHIAAHLGMSPGNLYYHFRNKEDIIHCIFDEYRKVFENNFHFEQDAEQLSAMQTLKKYLDLAYELMSKFNFFYTSLPEIIQRDTSLQNKYLQVQDLVHEDVKKLLFWLNREQITDIPEKDLNGLIHLIKMTTVFWVSYCRSQAPTKVLDTSDYYHGVLMIFALFKPYFCAEKRAECEQLEASYRALANLPH